MITTILGNDVPVRSPASRPSALRRFRIPLRVDPQPLKQKRYTEPVSHTVCIAAKCMIHKRTTPAVILCSDELIEIEDSAKGSLPFKALAIADDVIAMFAGSVCKTTELIRRYQSYFRRNKTKQT